MDKYDFAKIRNLSVGPEAITFLSKTSQGGFAAPVTLYQSQRSAVRKDMIEGGKLVQRQQINFRVFQSDLTANSAAAPKADDRVVDSNGVTYVVPSVTVTMLGQIYDLNDCQLLVR